MQILFLRSYGVEFVGSFAKLRKAAINFISVYPSVRPSVRPLGTTRVPLEGLLWDFIFEYF